METFSQYQDFVASMKTYPSKHSIIYPALGLSGESGEIAEKVKKWLREDLSGSEVMTHPQREAILKELGDPLWYIASLAADLGYTLQDVVDANVVKLSSRKERGVLKGSGDDR